MAITRKLRQKVRDGSVREMWQEMKWIFAYIRRYRAAVGIHILLGILGHGALAAVERGHEDAHRRRHRF